MLTGVPMEIRVARDCPTQRGDQLRGLENTHTFSDSFCNKLGDVSVALAKGLDWVNDQTGNYILDTIEIYVEMTSRGELRLVAASGSEVTGAIKLTFRARPDNLGSHLVQEG